MMPPSLFPFLYIEAFTLNVSSRATKLQNSQIWHGARHDLFVLSINAYVHSTIPHQDTYEYGTRLVELQLHDDMEPQPQQDDETDKRHWQ